jgi:hypothetical protein
MTRIFQSLTQINKWGNTESLLICPAISFNCNKVPCYMYCRKRYDRMTVNNENGAMLEEIVIANLKAVFQHLTRRTKQQMRPTAYRMLIWTNRPAPYTANRLSLHQNQVRMMAWETQRIFVLSSRFRISRTTSACNQQRVLSPARHCHVSIEYSRLQILTTVGSILFHFPNLKSSLLEWITFAFGFTRMLQRSAADGNYL